MMTFDPHTPEYWDGKDLQQEFTRVLDICNGCRLCDGLCPPFVDVFDRIDEIDDALTAQGKGKENPVLELKGSDYKHVVDYCYQCKLCFPKCPYTPPHEYMLDFPRLLLRAQAIEVKEQGKTLTERVRDQFIGDADRTGAIGAAVPGVMNWANNNPAVRLLMEKTLGIHRDKELPKYYKETFRDWFDKRGHKKLDQPKERVAIFFTCQINSNKPWIGKQFVEILERHGIEVLMPEQECCGMPELGTGNVDWVIETVDRNVARLKPIVDQGYKIITMSPSCSLMLRTEYAHYATNKEAARAIQAQVMDPSEYLLSLVRKKTIQLHFTEQQERLISYHLPCHLRVQNIGYPSRDLLKQIPNAKVNMIQQCSGHDGAWSMKQEFYEISLDVGKKLFKGIEKEPPTHVASDCTLAHLHIHEGTDRLSLHPIEIVYDALGYSEHQSYETA